MSTQGQPSEEELRAAYEAEMKRVRVEDLLLDTVAGWPINASLVAFTAWYPLRQLRAAGYMRVTPAPLSTMDAVELAVEESAPTTG